MRRILHLAVGVGLAVGVPRCSWAETPDPLISTTDQFPYMTEALLAPGILKLEPAALVLETGDLEVDTSSPFGFHPARVTRFGYPDNGFIDAQKIGVGWTRPSLYAFWFLVQPDLDDPTYDFTEYDQLYGSVPEGIQILANIAPQGHIDEGRCLPGSWLPVDEAAYAAFVTATVERYDGDGVGDMPGLVRPIKYWQVGNEPDDRTKTDFAELQRITYQAIKEACSGCQVLIGGVPGFPFHYVAGFDAGYAPILEDLAGQFVDIFDFHWYGTASGEYRLTDTATGEDAYEHIRSTLAGAGFPENLPVWITEMGAYSGSPGPPPLTTFAPQTEGEQAGDYFKRFIYSFSRGVEKVFPAFGLMEGFKHDDGYFDHTGLIYDGEGSDDLGLGVKKLGYYTYKLMAEKLDDADWSSLTTVHDGTGGDHLYLYRVTKNGTNAGIAWWDWFDDPSYEPGDSTTVVLHVATVDSVRVTAMVPDADSGADLDEDDYPTFFPVRVLPVQGDSVAVTLATSPVVVEPLGAAATVAENGPDLPPVLRIEQNRPNPFNPRSSIVYELARPAFVTIAVYNLAGECVEVLMEGMAEPGLHVVGWNARDLPSGIYFCRISAGGLSAVRKCLLVR